MAQLRGTGTSRASIFVIAGIAVLAIVVVVLAIAALQVGEVPEPAGERGANEVLITPAPEEPEAPEPLPLPEVQPTAALLSVSGSDDDGALTYWRTNGGACVPGEAEAAQAQIERTADLVEWSTLTPTRFDMREIVFLRAITPVIAEAVVLEGPECAPQVIRSFTSGAFWEPYDDSLAGAVYVAADNSVIVGTSAVTAAPCDAARTPSGQSERLVALVCENALQWWQGETWVPQEVPGVHSASLASGGATVVTSSLQREECAGALLQRWASPGELLSERCLEGVAPVAVLASEAEVLVWSEAGVETHAL